MQEEKSQEIGIGLIGCGVVGQGVLKLLSDHAEQLHESIGAKLRVRHIVVRDLNKPRGPFAEAVHVTDNIELLMRDPEVDIVVEVAGPVEPMLPIAERALRDGKSIVSANKALLARHGARLLAEADANGVKLLFEAAVGGGIPVIRVLREALVSDRLESVTGIINGTSNYILSRMKEAGISFAEALKGAQEAGYAEADPTLDVGGGDAAHKAALIAMLAFHKQVKPEHVRTEGIDRVSPIDMRLAERFGYVIKPLFVVRRLADDSLDLRVHPALIDRRNVLASVSGALNAVHIQGAALGPCVLTGYGAGAMPTAVSVVSDLADAARHVVMRGRSHRTPSPARAFDEPTVRDIGEHEGRYYLRLSVADKPGVLARIAGALGAFNVSIEQMVQEGHATANGEETHAPVTLVILTHQAKEKSVQAAIQEIHCFDPVAEPIHLLRIHP